MSRDTHLAALGQRHDALEKEIARELTHPAKDEFKLAEMKRRKLQLKDEIARLLSNPSSPSTLH
ncbi:MAG TPA: YdcH family protein [Methylocella sp.]|nr:YdcH family protein [Methylocella sp.]